jgi:hypothetical protein
VRYAAQHGGSRVARVITAGAVPPVMLKSEANPEGTPIEALDDIRNGVLYDRSQFYKDLSEPFFGANRECSAISQGAKDDFWRQGMLVNLTAAYDCVKAFSETDFTEDLKALTVPIFIADRADRRGGTENRRTRPARHPQGLPRCTARNLRRLPEGLGRRHSRLHRPVAAPLSPSGTKVTTR